MGLGEGRVRVCGFSSLAVLEPLTSRLRNATARQAILPHCTKGRGGQKRKEFIGALIREVICGVICCRVASLFIRSRVHRLSLGKGEGRVRVVGSSFRRVAKPLTSRLRSATAWQAILSPVSKGRGDPNALTLIEEFIGNYRADAARQALVRLRGIAQGFSCHHG